MGWVALAGTALSAFGQVKGGQNAADVYEYNQQLAKYRSKYAQQKGEIEVQALERDVKGYIGRQRAIAGKSGTVTDAGSNADAVARTRSEADIDASIIRYNADIESWMAENEANLLGTQANQALTAGYIGAGGTLLGGASKWDYKKTQLKTYSPPDRKFGVGPGV